MMMSTFSHMLIPNDNDKHVDDLRFILSQHNTKF